MPDETPSPNSGGPRSPEQNIADAELLFQDVPSTRSKPTSQVGQGVSLNPDDVFDLGDHPVTSKPRSEQGATRAPSEQNQPNVPTTPLRPEPTNPRKLAEERFKEASRQAFPTGDEVDQVWTRVQEWGPSIAVLVAWMFFLAVTLYVALTAEFFTFALLVFVLGGLSIVYLSYPILITLERPVRMTPETAVKDYYAALSHHIPHYKRMWLLLSRQAKLTPYFGSYEGFRKYWKKRIADLKSNAGARQTTPLLFQVDNFVSERNSDKTQAQSRFVVRVYVRGRRSEGPILEVPMKVDLLRGPDNMWYLCKGIIPDGEPLR